MKITRTYPQPDSNLSNIGPRERAMAVFKYLLDIEPEAATQHPLFACIVHSYEQSEQRGHFIREGIPECLDQLEHSLVPMLSSERTSDFTVHPYYDGKL